MSIIKRIFLINELLLFKFSIKFGRMLSPYRIYPIIPKVNVIIVMMIHDTVINFGNLFLFLTELNNSGKTT